MRPPGTAPEASLTEEEAAYSLAALLAGADGVVTHAESRRVEAEWARFAAARGLSPARAREVAHHCRELRARLGSAALLAACERTLRSSPHGKEAVRLAERVAMADGELRGREAAEIERLRAAVGLEGGRA